MRNLLWFLSMLLILRNDLLPNLSKKPTETTLTIPDYMFMQGSTTYIHMTKQKSPTWGMKLKLKLSKHVQEI